MSKVICISLFFRPTADQHSPHVLLSLAGWLLLVCLALPVAAQPDESQTLERVQAERDAFFAQHREAQAVINNLRQILETMNISVEKLTDQNEALRQELVTTKSELAGLKQTHSQLTDETRQLEKQTEILKQDVAAAAPAPAPTPDPDRAEQDERIESSYDAEVDRTTLTFGPEPVEAEGSPGKFFFSIIAQHAGKVPSEIPGAVAGEFPGAGAGAGGLPGGVVMFIQAERSGRVFSGQASVTFAVDGELVTLPIAEVQVTARRSGQPGRSRSDRSDETVRLPVDAAVLARLGAGRSLTITQDRTVITFDREDGGALRAMARRLGGG